MAAHALVANNFPQAGQVDVFDCYESVADTYRRILPGRTVRFHGKLLDGLPALESIVGDLLNEVPTG